MKETGGIKLFDGTVYYCERKTEAGFTFVNVKLRGKCEYVHREFEFRGKNEVLVAYRDEKLVYFGIKDYRFVFYFDYTDNIRMI